MTNGKRPHLRDVVSESGYYLTAVCTEGYLYQLYYRSNKLCATELSHLTKTCIPVPAVPSTRASIVKLVKFLKEGGWNSKADGVFVVKVDVVDFGKINTNLHLEPRTIKVEWLDKPIRISISLLLGKYHKRSVWCI